MNKTWWQERIITSTEGEEKKGKQQQKKITFYVGDNVVTVLLENKCSW